MKAKYLEYLEVCWVKSSRKKLSVQERYNWKIIRQKSESKSLEYFVEKYLEIYWTKITSEMFEIFCWKMLKKIIG